MAVYAHSADCLTVGGRLDDAEADRFYTHALSALSRGTAEIVLDLRAIPYIASSCISALASLWLDCLEKRKSLKVRPSRAVARVLEMCGLDKVYGLPKDEPYGDARN